MMKRTGQRVLAGRKRQEAKYPISAAKAGLFGGVTFIIAINREGNNNEYIVKKSYPKGVFDKHAAIALSI